MSALTLSLREAAELLGLNPGRSGRAGTQRLYKMHRRGELRLERFGDTLRVPLVELQRLSPTAAVHVQQAQAQEPDRANGDGDDPASRPLFYTVTEVAEIFRFPCGNAGKVRVRGLVNAGQLRAVRFGRDLRIPAAEIDRLAHSA